MTLPLLNNPVLPDALHADLYSTAGTIYLIQKNYRSSLTTLLFCLHQFAIDDPFVLKMLYNNIAIDFFFLQEEGAAEDYFQKSIAVSLSLKDTVTLSSTYTNIANLYYNNYQDSVALLYFRKALSTALLTHDFKLKQEAYLNMAVIAENKKDYSSALRYRKWYEDQHDSLYDRDNIWNFAQQKNKLDSELNARKIQLANQANKLQALKLDKQKQQLSFALLTSAAFLSFFLFALYAYRQKNKQNRIITAQREELDALNRTKDQLFSVVAHDLRSPVQTMKISLSRLRQALGNNDVHGADRVTEEIESLSNSTYSLLNNLLYWALSQTGQLHFFGDKLNMKRIAEQVLYDYVSLAATKNVVLENLIEEELYCKADMNTVKIILRNLVDNAIKFSMPSTSVVVSGAKKNGQCVLSVANSGQRINDTVIQMLRDKNTKRVEGGHTQGQSTGIGLWLVKTMAERNGGSLQIEKKTDGAQIHIYLPEYLAHEQAQNIDP